MRSTLKPTLLEKSRPGAGGKWVSDHDFQDEPVNDLFPDIDIRDDDLGLPDASEVEVVRHYTELSKRCHGVDNGAYPLGSCTMKYNPKRHDRYAQLDGFADVHPHQPQSTMQGVMALLYNLERHIAELMGVDCVSLQPAAGAHGELVGMLVLRKYFEDKGESNRKIILIADSAHGTNPASAAMAGFDCRIIPTTPEGLMDLNVLQASMSQDVAGLMLTNPSTLGLFDKNIAMISDIVHIKGALLYYDGANLNALMGRVRPGDMGFDIVHINTHKTLSTPHGGGGPGAGPVGVKEFLSPYLPVPIVNRNDDGSYYFDYQVPKSIGRVKSHYGHITVLIRAYAYILAMGPDGLKKASEDAVLNANYIQNQLKDILPPVFDSHCMHECLLSGRDLPVSPFSFAKRLIDLNLHPPTLVGAGCVYFPEALGNSMLIEPTESETKDSLDLIVSTFRRVYHEACADADFVNEAPHAGHSRKIPEFPRVFED